MTLATVPMQVRAQALLRLRQRRGQRTTAARYQSDPEAWIVDRLGVAPETLAWSRSPEYAGHRWDGTPDPLVAVLRGLADGKNVGVESGTGTGKTYLGACAVFWFLACFEDAIVVTSAPKAEQLRLHIWKEVGRLWPRFQRSYPGAELIDLKLRMRGGQAEKETWAAVGFGCGVEAGSVSAVRAQGFHAEHMLIVLEETPGIHPAVMEAFENTCTARHNLRLAFGNPDNQSDALHQFCQQPGTVHVRVSALDHPNVVTKRSIVPGAVDQATIDRRLARYRSPEHRLYQSRVRGISPSESAEALIRRAWCVDAETRYNSVALREGAGALGVDVANSEDGDSGAIARFQGAVCLSVVSFPCPDANLLGARVHVEARELEITDDQIGVDPVGVGAGTVNELKRLGRRVPILNAGQKALPSVDEDTRYPAGHERGPLVIEEERFANFRAQLWWQARRDLELQRVGLPDDPELFEDLCTPSWWTHNGKIHVESKEDIRERLGRSPDKGDAFCLGNWVRSRKRTTAAPKPPADRNADRGMEEVLKRLDRRPAPQGTLKRVPAPARKTNGNGRHVVR